ncbi:hypothetical protein KAR91_87120 [Candidatus Pacearchaeota archaeon]|nr:hypothetical protein [Candidatus Pacearchaeota archaeon]
MKIVNIRLTDEIWKRVQAIQKKQSYKTVHVILMEAIDNGLSEQEKI